MIDAHTCECSLAHTYLHAVLSPFTIFNPIAGEYTLTVLLARGLNHNIDTPSTTTYACMYTPAYMPSLTSVYSIAGEYTLTVLLARGLNHNIDTPSTTTTTTPPPALTGADGLTARYYTNRCVHVTSMIH
jgi:hypothetical protein